MTLWFYRRFKVALWLGTWSHRWLFTWKEILEYNQSVDDFGLREKKMIDNDWYLRMLEPIVYHIICGIENDGPSYEGPYEYTKPSGWFSYVVLPHAKPKANS